MKKIFSEDHVLPRPVERLPEYAHARARQTLATRLSDAFQLTDEAASAIANVVVDPAAVRKAIGEPTDPEVEEISVPGGTLLGIRTQVWARRVMPDPRNPRILPSRRHPFAVVPGTAGEESKFRPVAEPRLKFDSKPHLAELMVDVENRHHLTWASQQAASFVLVENDWRASIASQGVMEAVWLAATTYQHGDETSPVTTVVSVEGSSRVTGVHNLLEIRSADVAYDDNDSALRSHIRKLNEAFERGASAEEAVAIRCEQIPALILVGFRPHPAGDTTFPTAVKSLVALRHVDPPKPWGEGPENESLADEVLDEWYRQGIISSTERDYFAGACTREEARAARLSDDPAIRASRLVRMFTNADPQIKEAIRKAVTSQSTRKRISAKMLNDLSTALILRANADEPLKADQIRRYMRLAFGQSVHGQKWNSTNRDIDTIKKEALAELNQSVDQPDPGPSSLELAVRAAYPMIVSERLKAQLGSRGNERVDRRAPSEVLDAMRRTPQGVFQLAQSLTDFGVGQSIRAVDETGQIKKLSDGSGDQTINDSYIRGEFPAPGKARAARPGDTPTEILENRLSGLADAVDRLAASFDSVRAVLGDDGRPLVESRGVDPRTCRAWRDVFRATDEELVVWGSTFKRMFGAASTDPDDEADQNVDEADHESEFFENLDSAAADAVTAG